MAIDRTPVLKRCRQLGVDPIELGYSSKKESKRQPKRRRNEIHRIAPGEVTPDRVAAKHHSAADGRHALPVESVPRPHRTGRRRGKAQLFRASEIALVRGGKLLSAEAEIAERLRTVYLHDLFSEHNFSRKGRTFSVMRRAT